MGKADTKAIGDFYNGKTITIVVGSSPGGGFDTYARMIGRYFGKYIPGNPNVIIENRPGAGSLIAANTVYNSAPKDGTTIVHFIGGQILQQLFDNPSVEFDARKYNWIGAPTRDTIVCIARADSGFKTLAEAKDSKQLIMGGQGPGAVIDDTINVLKTVGDLNIKIVPGYRGTKDILLATEQGEVMGTCLGWGGLRVPLGEKFASGELVVLGQGVRQPHPDLPDVPLMRDLATDEKGRLLVDVGITYANEFLRAFAAPPGVPAERVQALRSAFMATFKDPEFLADAKKAQLDLDPISGEQFDQIIKDVFALSPEVVANLKKAYAGQ